MADKRLLITGAAGFVGRNAVKYFSKLGLEVIGICRNPAEVEELTAWMKQEGIERVSVAFAELSDDAKLASVFDEFKRRWKTMPYLFNAAGAFEYMPLVDADPRKVDAMVQANFVSNVFLFKHALRLMKDAGFGRIVVVSAAASLNNAGAGMGVYAGTKAALNCLVQSANAEMAGRDFVAEAIYPTIIDTPRNRKEMPDAGFDEWLTVEDVLDEVENLLSETRKPAN